MPGIIISLYSTPVWYFGIGSYIALAGLALIYIAFKTINARCEEINKKPSFRGSYKNKRCLIPATGFFEWDKSTKTKVPYLFLRKDRKIFSFAGLFDRWIDQNGREVITYTILTTKANEVVGKIHDRMPVVLRREDEDVWADNHEFDSTKLGNLFKPFPSELMSSYQVGQEVNSPINNNPKLLEKAE